MATHSQLSPTIRFLLPLLILQCITTTLAQAPAPAPAGPTNITKILEKAGQFTTLIRLFGMTQVGNQINTQLNNSNQGMTVFAPTDNAFSGLKAGTLNSLSDQQKVELLQFHVVPNFLSTSQFQTISNPLRTQAGDSASNKFPLNITTSGNQVNVTTGVVDATVANTIYTDGTLAVYQVDKVLLPMSLFGPQSPAPAPEPVKKKKSGSDDETPATDDGSASADASGAVSFGAHLHGLIVGSIEAIAFIGMFYL
ncbi:fasciclin-like arabinogalactan protein 11 [Cynara cardunculus var. scolymus]|uniref:FAS1 domain-containing protein n=1 Tax=Cynara cardunculus var. scolymus TaxID=59895 RepID=A0A103XHH1_CYNCS|nr:fasciclin-like arabinogalactan protein 11 [Cynara cardunculus var. scolymus]KVH90799.1 FAS1 domain-containing protein [Cynara cardunculus var. scolymus]